MMGGEWSSSQQSNRSSTAKSRSQRLQPDKAARNHAYSRVITQWTLPIGPPKAQVGQATAAGSVDPLAQSIAALICSLMASLEEWLTIADSLLYAVRESAWLRA